MNDYGVSPLSVLQMAAPMIVLPIVLWLLVLCPSLVYPFARWKAHRDQVVDPQLGLKVALHYFKLLAFHAMLLGAVFIIWTVISKGGGKGSAYRMGAGFLVPGALVYTLHAYGFLPRTNDLVQPGVRRLFLGYNLLVTGLVGFIALVAACQALFAKGSVGNDGRLLFASLLVYGSAWAACGVQFASFVSGDSGASSGSSTAMPPAATPPAAHAGSGGPALPSLSSGAFPPIEPNS